MKLKGNIITSNNKLTGSIMTIGTTHNDYYDGEYVVTPLFRDVNLPTANLVMKQDVTVQSIPIFQTENLGGGYTVILGGND